MTQTMRNAARSRFASAARIRAPRAIQAMTTQATPASRSVLFRKAEACACGGSCPRCQAKSALKIGAPNDPYERQADAVADAVMRADGAGSVASTTAAPGLQRKCAACEDPSEESGLQAKAASALASASTTPRSAPASVDAVLRSPGQALDSETRAFFEPRFGRNFADVHVHSDRAAQQSAREVNAQAYTVGHDIVFGTGRFAPGTQDGRHLLAHELAHVVQQSGADEMQDRGRDDEGHSRSSMSHQHSGMGFGIQRQEEPVAPTSAAPSESEGATPQTGKWDCFWWWATSEEEKTQICERQSVERCKPTCAQFAEGSPERSACLNCCWCHVLDCIATCEFPNIFADTGCKHAPGPCGESRGSSAPPP